jgi:hypothetical protein
MFFPCSWQEQSGQSMQVFLKSRLITENLSPLHCSLAKTSFIAKFSFEEKEMHIAQDESIAGYG